MGMSASKLSDKAALSTRRLSTDVSNMSGLNFDLLKRPLVQCNDLCDDHDGELRASYDK
jgi:hypothetical protein